MTTLFDFGPLAGETIDARMVRAAETALADGPMGYALRGDWYASFINAGLNPAGKVGAMSVVSIASWHTSCALFIRALLAACGRAVKLAINASGIYLYVEMDEHSFIWVPNDGKLVVQPGDIPYWANTGSDGHVELVRRVRADGVVETAGGGGGTDGTGCSLRVKAAGCLDGWGRRLRGVWRIAKDRDRNMILPASPILIGGDLVRDNLGDDVGPTGRALRGELAGVVHPAEFDPIDPKLLRSLSWPGGIAA